MKLVISTEGRDQFVEAAEVDIGGGAERFAAHRATDEGIKGSAWAVTHVDTGFRVAAGSTAKNALELAAAKWAASTPEQRDAALDKARQFLASRLNVECKGVLS